MSVVVRHQPKGLTREQYDEVSRRMEGTGSWPPDGMDLHVLFGSDGDLRVSEIWDSEDQFRAFAGRLMATLDEVGVSYSRRTSCRSGPSPRRRGCDGRARAAAGAPGRTVSTQAPQSVRSPSPATQRTPPTSWRTISLSPPLAVYEAPKCPIPDTKVRPSRYLCTSPVPSSSQPS